ncbi:PBECR3 domain-containing polyvalent protein [Treponema phagedenis]|uniref:PBECR3 domain-containing polyvalent protein n=2 Tax=Treponema phagedenis TaxID=162 RepID=UPI0011EDFF6F|nr:hypothetical protein [Treponema phagedenis]TYT77821.1 hypothetical protein FS559_01105 [Treponema phagedenis]
MRTVLLLRKSAESEKLIFNAIKKKILEHLTSLEEKEKATIEKAFSKMLMLAKGGKGLPVGTVRDWKGKKFIKTAPGKWKPKYESHSRGAKLAISALKKKIAACDTAKDMMNVMLENRDRFSDKNGNPLPFVQELSKFITETQEKKRTGGASKKETLSENDKKYYKTLLIDTAEKFRVGTGTKDEYQKYLGEPINTPLGIVKMGENQYQKFVKNNRQDLFIAAHDTLKDPALVFTAENGAKVYTKCFLTSKGKQKNIVSITIDKGDVSVSISTHEERLNQIFKKIEKAGILYEKEPGSRDGTVHRKGAADRDGITHIPTTSIPDSDKKTSAGLEKNHKQYYAAEHTSGDEAGKFTNKGAEKKWYEKPPATEKELLDFAKRAIEENANERLFVGHVSSEAQKRIKEVTGLDAKSIILDSNSVRHVMNKEAHNLELEDLKYMQEVINDPSSIKLSERKHRYNPVIEFRKDINGEITFVEEFRSNRGQLELVTCYRKKRKSAVKVSMLRKSTPPETNVRNCDDGQTDISISQSQEKSSIKKAG